jgi:phospholipase C
MLDATVPSHLQQVHAALVSRLPVPDERGGVHHTMPEMKTSQEYSEYIRLRTAAWQAAKHSNAGSARCTKVVNPVR